VIDLSEYSSALQFADGLWTAPARDPVSYPGEGNAFCFQLEETSFWFRHRNACILAAARNHLQGGVIFDIGGGNGFVSRALQAAGLTPVLVEPGPAGAANALRRGVATVVRATLEDAAFRPESLPNAGLFDVLEHVGADAGFLDRVFALLRPGGRLLLTVPAYRWLWSDEDAVAGHHRRYGRRDLTARLAGAGFEPQYVTGFFHFLVLPVLLGRALPARLGRRRRALDPASHRSAHRSRGGLPGALVAALGRLEEGRIARGGRIPFGSSLLAVARKPA